MKMEKFEQASQDIREIEWVKQQVKAELSSLQQPVQQELFYQKDGDKVTYNLPLVKTYLEHIKEKSWSELTQKNSSAWIMAVQIALESQGYDVGKVDGLWWEFTKAAVENFQDRNGLNKDGMPWRLTIQKLAEVMGTPAKAEGTSAKAEGTPAKAAEKLPQIELSDLGEWQGKKFIFKEGVEKTDQKGKYIEIGGQRCDQWKEGLTWLGYQVGININDMGRFYLWAYVDGKLHGKGKIVWSNGDVYEWDWKDDQRIGKGKYTWSNGNVYEWDWKDNNLHGKGKQVWSDGDVYEWDWKDDKRDGKGKYTFKDGQTQGGYYENGKLLFWGKKTGKDLSQQRGTVKLTEKYEVDQQKQISQIRTVESWWTAITLRDDASGYHFSTKSGDKLTLPKSLWRQKALAAANLINAAVGIVKKSGFQLDEFEADGDILQADYKKYIWDTDLILNVQEKFWVSATVLADWMNEYRKEVGI